MAIELTKKEIGWIQGKYPKLKKESDTVWSGEIEFNRKFNNIPIKSAYLLEINFEPKPESMLPQVKELGGEIEKISKELDLSTIDLHRNNDGTICLCIYKKEKEYFQKDFTVKVFFEDILEPYLYWVRFYQKHKRPPWDDYAHGELGYLELYAEGDITLEELKKCVDIDKLSSFRKYKGHHPCPCGSGKKLRNCHKLLYNSFYKLKNEFHG